MKEITFKYQKDDRYRLVPSNGAYGGVTPRGDFRFDLYYESAGLPDSVKNQVTGDGLGPDLEKDPPAEVFQRDTMVGVVMTVEAAEGLAQWILQSVRQHRAKLQNKRGQGDQQ